MAALPSKEQAIADVYYHPRYGFGSVEETHRHASMKHPGVNRADVREFLAKQEHRQRRKPLKTNSFVADFVRQEFQVDLADFGFSARPRYGFVAVDIFSKKAVCVPIKTKTAEQTTLALHKTFDELGYPASIMLDEGGEFGSSFAELCKANDIDLIKSRTGGRFVERFIRTLKMALSARVLSLGGKWSDYVTDVVDKYNDTKHSSTHFRPDILAASEKHGYLMTKIAHKNLLSHASFKHTHPDIAVGDHVKVRIKQPNAGYKETFNSWSPEVYVVARIDSEPQGMVYHLNGYRRPLLRFELLKVSDVQRPSASGVRSVLHERLAVPPPQPAQQPEPPQFLKRKRLVRIDE